MKYYPVYLDIQNRKCLVVGGGSVGTRKVKSLVNCGAAVTVISLTLTRELAAMAESGIISAEKRPFQPGDLDGAFLVIGATSDVEQNKKISKEAGRLNIMCNIADFPEACSFILPSVLGRGDLMIAISTSGKSPAFAKKLRKDFEKQFGEEYAVFLDLMGAVRQTLLKEQHEPEAHKPLFEKLIEAGLPEMIRADKKDAINAVLLEVLGSGYTFNELLNPGKGSAK